MPKEPFKIDISDPGVIKEQIPLVEAQVEGARAAMRDAQEDLTYWNTILDRLRLLSGEPRPTLDVSTNKTIQSAVLDIVNASPAPLRATDVIKQLPKPTKRETVSWALWNAEREGLIQRLGHGLYASLAVSPTESLRRASEDGNGKD